MKIVHCLNHFLPDEIGGTEIYILSLAKSLLNDDVESVVVIPNYGKEGNETYFVEDTRVIKFGEPSIASRAMIMGKEIPKGLENFKNVLSEEKPDVVHFHTIINSIGITLHHLVAAKTLGYKTVMTIHLAGYSCQTGNLMIRNKELCDGFIDIKRCTDCCYAVKPISILKRKILLPVAMAAYRINYDTTNWQSSLGTAIGFPFVIQHLKERLFSIIDNADRVVVLTKWYKKVLLLNGIKENKLTYIAQGLPVQDGVNNILNVHDEIKLVYIGRIKEEKGLHLLLAVIQGLPKYKISLDIYGQLNETAYCKTWIDKTSGMSNVTWKGTIEPSTVVNTLRQYDLLCIPSLICEMSPLVIREAYAAGIPVIASDVYGNAEQIDDGVNGWLFKFNDSDDLKMKLQMLVEKPGMITNAKKNIPPVRLFSDVAREYKILYEEILASS